MKNCRPALLILALVAASATYAAECGNPPPPPCCERKGPPPQMDPALCKDKAAGAVVEMKTPDGKTIKGTCQLVFLPERPAGERPGPEGQAK